MFDNFIGEAKGIFNVATLIEMIVSLICSVLGLIFISNNAMNFVLVAVIIGIISIVTGAGHIISYLNRENIDLFNMNMFFGIVFILLGVITFFLGKYVHIALAIYIIMVAANKLYYGFLLKKFNESSWLFTSVMGGLFIVISIVMFLTNIEKAVSVAGIGLFGYGVMNIANNILLRKRSRYFIA